MSVLQAVVICNKNYADCLKLLCNQSSKLLIPGSGDFDCLFVTVLVSFSQLSFDSSLACGESWTVLAVLYTYSSKNGIKNIIGHNFYFYHA